MAIDLIFKALGIIGLILIILGVLSKRKKGEDALFLVGGIFLITYSIFIKDMIFIVLQAVFILASGYELFIANKKKKKN